MDTDLTNLSGDEHTAVDADASVTEEELFETYLAARVEQALDTLNRARDALAAQPGDFDRVIQVMRRVHELRELNEQLGVQHARAAAARAAAGLETTVPETPAGEGAVPGSAFRAAQAEQAEKVMTKLAAQPQTCPACQALLEPNSGQCRCGFDATDGESARQTSPNHDSPPFNA